MKKKAPVVKNQEFDATVIDLTYEGNGVVKVDDFPIFVANAVPGEEIRVGITKVAGTYAFGRVIKTLKESADRNKEVDVATLTTGIAPLAHLNYDAQLRFKQNQIQELFKKQHVDVEVSETLGMENPTGYRNKAQIPTRELRGELTTGFFRRGSHNLMPIEDFYIQDPEIDKAIVVIRDILRKYHIPAYNEFEHTGVIRNIMVRRGYYSHEMMVVLVTRSKKVPGAEMIVADIREALPEVKSIIQNVNQEKTNVILGEKNNTLWGKDVITDTLFGKKFVIGPNSFYQVNPQTTETLYQLAADKAGLTGDEEVIDAYSGIGTISLTIADRVKSVLGVEVVPGAVDDAKRNADINGVNNAKFELGKAEEKMVEWHEAGMRPDVIFVDPPRKGLTPELIDAATGMEPEKFVYISCNPATLARDTVQILENGYHIQGPVQPIDQFPQTTHIESVTVFVKD
ncbi:MULTISPECIES: 23S rRNA (uracil(1939)-C(5))-methyltransferase RlmD [Weissella]|jgi:23S rRNA (uracil-5-)-methyltransferase RumA|uniref:23S rRNA (Uracil-5-)-methyltransferase RumA n=1 Tax=Weissella cibaria TaxID=137591 RepID=A0A1X4JNL2_9LACO|nr:MULTISPECIES: 23S rRNA (uracil(1939)-C(5))-methyltransferase RlmD [Weissella]APS27901.1 23S rRNA (uracil-C(5))-methyltransferase RlmCD [Weissella cibaria]APU63300.1 23S rRNA (uracil-C(5))-methyltransferase RlmCD [Weissella cibaria]APU65450.1 23S rRNA (uracil-C(5))-methyltransferase RlmCD [Weissella cibaria]ASS51173.1 23S rRNA (uracil-C(5))-methyltransferase RlmCD [Weissella cibaria]AVO66205.1 23S rRNA (uracil(1939)-C(5))-methyltransferase RlmD [Weissella cibaria]